MPYKLVKAPNSLNNLLLYIVLFVIALWAIKKICNNVEHFKIYSSSNKDLICSKKCCSTEWPTPITYQDNSVNYMDIGYDKKFRTSNINCNDGKQNTGCICVPNNDQANYVPGIFN